MDQTPLQRTIEHVVTDGRGFPIRIDRRNTHSSVGSPRAIPPSFRDSEVGVQMSLILMDELDGSYRGESTPRDECGKIQKLINQYTREGVSILRITDSVSFNRALRNLDTRPRPHEYVYSPGGTLSPGGFFGSPISMFNEGYFIK